MIHQVKIIEGSKTYYDSIKEDKFEGDVLDIIKICDKHNLKSNKNGFIEAEILFKSKKGEWLHHAPYVAKLNKK